MFTRRYYFRFISAKGIFEALLDGCLGEGWAISPCITALKTASLTLTREEWLQLVERHKGESSNLKNLEKVIQADSSGQSKKFNNLDKSIEDLTPINQVSKAYRTLFEQKPDDYWKVTSKSNGKYFLFFHENREKGNICYLNGNDPFCQPIKAETKPQKKIKDINLWWEIKIKSQNELLLKNHGTGRYLTIRCG